MTNSTPEDSRLEIAHVLFVDIVGYSKLLVNQQSDMLRQLNEIVRTSDQFREAEAADKLVRLPTGDGMALVFFSSPDAPLRCAMEVARRLKDFPQLQVRMGIHSGPVDVVHDVNDRVNVTGAGINTAQRVMDCGDAGHVLLSKRAADDLAQYEHWQRYLYDLGECEVKHGLTIEVVNFFDGVGGSLELPEKFKRKQHASALESRAAVLRKRRLVLLSLGIVLLGLLITGLAVRWQARPVAPEKSIAILPFKPLVAGITDPVLEMGMADTLITKLSGSTGMIVASLHSASAVADEDPVAAGRKLGVSSVLEGVVQRAGDRLRVTVRLIKVADGSSPWSGTYDEKFTDVFSVQDTISQKVVEALALKLNPEDQKRLTRRYTDNLDAYQLYLTGRFHYGKLSPPELTKSIGYFEQAIALDQNYALAYYGLAESYRSIAMVGDLRPKDTFPQAAAAARKAIELDPSLAEPHVTLEFVLTWFEWDWEGAEKEARRAIELNPNLPFAHIALAQVLAAKGRFEEALEHASRARQLDPVSPLMMAFNGSALIEVKRYDAARDLLQHALELNPEFWLAHHFLGHLYTVQGKYPEALAELDLAVQYSHGNSDATSARAYIWAITGEKAKAQQTLEELKQEATQRYIPPASIAVIFYGLGDLDQTFAWLEKGCEERDPHLTFLRDDSKWDRIRGDPRFISILQRVGLSGSAR
jgi:TolB-like protein/Tfp pilus assembly protein PilF